MALFHFERLFFNPLFFIGFHFLNEGKEMLVQALLLSSLDPRAQLDNIKVK